MALTDNHFVLFDLPVSFEVDKQHLADTYRQLQSEYHPDRFATESDEKRRFAQQTAAQINEAYQTLKQPLARGRYLLAIKGTPIDDAQNPNMDTSFLMHQLELREKLDLLPQHSHAIDELDDFMENIEKDIAELVTAISHHFAMDALESAKSTIYKLHFLNRLHQDALALEEKLDD